MFGPIIHQEMKIPEKPTRMAGIKRTDNTKRWQNVNLLPLLYVMGVHESLCALTGAQMFTL